MDQPKKNKSKIKRPDTPLATTPEPSIYDKSQAIINARNKIKAQEEEQKKEMKKVVINQIEKERKVLDSIKGAGMNNRTNNIEGAQSRSNSSSSQNRNPSSSLLNRR